MKKEKKYYYLAALFFLFFLFSAVPKVTFGWSDPYVTSSTVTESYTYTEAVWVDCHWVFEAIIYVCERCPGSGSSCRPYCTRDGVYGYYNCYSSQCRNTNHPVGSLKKHAEIWKNTCGGVYCTNVSRPPAGDHWEYVTRTGYRNVTVNTCHYISAVNSWTPCSMEGVQVATSVTWSTVSGTSCSNVPLTRSCTPPPRDNLAINFSGAGFGRVTSNPAGIDCYKKTSGPSGSGTCNKLFERGKPVFLSYFPNTANSYCSGGVCGPASVLINAGGSSATANFTLKPKIEVTISGCGTVTGTGSSGPCSNYGGIQPNPCIFYNSPGTPVHLSAVSCGNSRFGSWSGNVVGCSNQTASCSFTMTGERKTFAHFASQSDANCDTPDCRNTCIGQPCDDSYGRETCKGTLSCPLWQEVQP